MGTVPVHRRAWCVLAAAALVAGCGHHRDAADLHARMVVLEREVSGLRAAVDKLERGEPLLPVDAVVVSISDSLVHDFLEAQLPVTIETDKVRISLSRARVTFRGSPLVTLAGTISSRDQPALSGKLRVLGALEGIDIDRESGTLRARVALDHVDILELPWLSGLLALGTEDEVARVVRQQLEGHIPGVEIPIRIEHAIDLPDVVDGPLRLQGASLPLTAGVADVYAGGGLLWVAVRVQPGAIVGRGEASARSVTGDTTAAVGAQR